MKIGLFGPLGGLVIAALILTLFTFNTVTDSPWRWLGFGLAVAAFAAGAWLGYGGKSLNDQAGPQ